MAIDVSTASQEGTKIHEGHASCLREDRDWRQHLITTRDRRSLNSMAKGPTARRNMKKATKAPSPKLKSRKYVYFFGSGKADGNRDMKDLLGGKGAGLAEMTNAGPPGRPGCRTSDQAPHIHYREKQKIPGAIDREIDEQVRKLEKAAGATLGSTDNPLLVSVRSGA